MRDGTAQGDSLFSALRLWLAVRLLPKGYAIWTFGAGDGYDLDEPVIEKEAA